MNEGSGPHIVLRESVFEDKENVQALKRSIGFGDDLLEDWDWLWRRNPVWRDAQTKPSIGWVLESEGRIVGYIGSISLKHFYREETLEVATTTGFAVDPAYRGHTLKLVAAFLNQPDKDILLNTTAIEVAGKIFQRFKASPMPQRDYDQILFWVLQPRGFINAALRYKSLHPVFARATSLLLSIPLKIYLYVKRKFPQVVAPSNTSTTTLRLINVLDIGRDFDEFWAKKSIQEKRLISYRTSEILRWHFAKARAKVLCCYRADELVGYAVVTQEKLEQFGIVRSKIADLFVESDSPDLVNQLLKGIYDYSKETGSHLLEVLGFPASIRDILLQSNPHSRALQSWPYFYFSSRSEFHDNLSNEEVWFACAFDGDTSLFS